MQHTERTAAIHRIVAAFASCAERLDVRVDRSVVERWGMLVHQAMAGRERSFHGHEHVFDLSRADDPIERLAGLFHDVVYLQVDHTTSPLVTPLLAPYFDAERALLPVESADPGGLLVYRVFGVQAGARLSVYGGLNELASALVAARALTPHLPLESVTEVVTCIEATIPFRATVDGRSPYDTLAERLSGAAGELRLGLDGGRVASAVRRAVRVANRDVENFAEPDPGRFLENTWRLLPESNPALRNPTGYTIREYRIALDKMESFLSALRAERVFHRWGGEPDVHVHDALVAAAARNLDLASRYLKCKLLAVAILEALAELTGGDVPIEMFTGALPRPYGPLPERIEHHLPVPERVALAPSPNAATLRALLASGRTGEADFDLRSSPLATFLLDALGEGGVATATEQARRWLRQETEAQRFLDGIPGRVIAAVASAAGRVASTRSEALGALAAAAEGRP